MLAFGDYSRCYNLLYRDKNYASEAEYVHRLIQTYAPNAKSMLELGCGTGRYSEKFESMGYEVTGVDVSEEMLMEARKTASPTCKFVLGDIRSIRLDKKFDVVTALFHVMSYQVTNQDVADTLSTIKEHLKIRGLVCFDFWYGPAVLDQGPEIRIKEVEDESIGITRIAGPIMHPRENRVDVNYKLFIRNKRAGQSQIEELQECHRMRYFFEPEWALFFRQAGFHLLKMEEAVSQKTPDFSTWGIMIIAEYSGSTWQDY